MVIRKVTAPFAADAKPRESHETVDVYDVEGLCGAIEELVRRRKRPPLGRVTHHRGAASGEL
jgi:hypothetical protein